jgi:hypothetical protein
MRHSHELRIHLLGLMRRHVYGATQEAPAQRRRDPSVGGQPKKPSKKASIAHTNLIFIGFMVLFSVCVSVCVRYTTG